MTRFLLVCGLVILIGLAVEGVLRWRDAARSAPLPPELGQYVKPNGRPDVFHFTDEEGSGYHDAVAWAWASTSLGPGMYYASTRRELGVASGSGQVQRASIGDWLVRMSDGSVVVVSDELYQKFFAPLDK